MLHIYPTRFDRLNDPPTLSEAGRRVRVHFVYYLPEVIVRRIKSDRKVSGVWGGSRGCSNRCSHNEIYDIGTEILLLTKNEHNSTQKAPKSIIPQEIKSPGHRLSFGSVKHQPQQQPQKNRSQQRGGGGRRPPPPLCWCGSQR